MKAIAHRSKRAKGKRLEALVAGMYRSILGIAARPMPMSGGGYFKGDIQKAVADGWVDECKNNEAHRIWDEWQQARKQALPVSKPVLYVSGNHRPVLAIITAEDYFQLRRAEMDALADRGD